MGPSDQERISRDVMVSFAHRQILVTVWFKKRKRMSITVYPDKTIIVRAPMRHTIEDVQRKLEKRVDWMIRQLDYFEQYHPILPERQYVSGETHYYLGRQYRLKVTAGSSNIVKLIGRYFMVSTTKPERREKTKRLMQDWYSKHARSLIHQRVLLYKDHVREMGALEPAIKFRRMKKRWGSCTSNGIITFNTELIKAPIHCIDYVVLHELCHLLDDGHSQKFYRLLDLLMPDWKKRKERLEQVILV